MYHPIYQFVLPRLGQLALNVLLYLNFLFLPPVRALAGQPLLYFGLPLAAALALAWVGRDPLGLGIVFTGHLLAFYSLQNVGAGLLRHFLPALWPAWQALWLYGLTPWLLTALVFWRARRRAVHLCTTRYDLTTDKPLPNGRLCIVQLSDLHPRAEAAMNRARIPELRQKIEACRPDLIVLTGDVFDEYTTREDFDAFCALFAALDAPLGKYYVPGNHDLFHLRHEPCFTRADLERAFADAHVRILEDVAVRTPDESVRIVGRRDYLDTGGRRFTAEQLLPHGAGGVYTVWLDHEPRDFAAAARAGADVILSGHTHAGQVWPGGVVGRAAQNELNYGSRAVTPQCTAIVSGGTGTWAYKFRTQGKTEIVCVTVTQNRKEPV